MTTPVVDADRLPIIVQANAGPVRSAAREGPATIRGIDTSTPVLVLTASPRARRSPHGGIGILRSLGRLGIPVFTVDTDPRGPSSHSRYLRGRFVFDVAAAPRQAAVDHLLDIARQVGSRPILVPTWDEASLLVSDFADVLSEGFLFPRQPENLARSLASKKEMYHLARGHAVPTPEATFPSGIEDVREFVARATFPVMLKGIAGNRLFERTGRKMVIVERPEELLRLYKEMEDPADPNVMLQEYIPGGDDVVWMFNGYFDHASNCLMGITGRKLRQTPVYTGATSLGVCLRNDVVDQTTRRWMKELGYRGILDIGYRFDARDGQYKVLDVNPRIGGTFRLFVARNGMDVARALYLDLTGQPVPPAEPIEGRKWMDERDVISSLQYRRDGRLTLRQWVGSLGGIQETVYFARDDLAPFLRAGSHVLNGSLGPDPAPMPPTGADGGPKRAEASRPTGSTSGRQEIVDRHFEASAEAWRSIYAERSVYGLIHQERRATALAWIDGLELSRGTPVLEIGCGAGLTSVALAERGLDVTAIDSASTMVQLTMKLADERGLGHSVHTSVADAHHLPFPDETFSLVLALGVFPWLHSPAQAMAEIARVLRPGGYVLANIDNAFRLHYLLDPRRNPVFTGPGRILATQLRRAGILRGAAPTPVRLDTPRRFEYLMARAGLHRERTTTYGFGPFTFWQRPILSDREGTRLHRTLQDLSDRGVPVIRAIGAQHLVQARKLSAPGAAGGRPELPVGPPLD